LRSHRLLIFGKGASPWTHKGKRITEQAALKVLNEENGELSLARVLRCRTRYFSAGAILGSEEFVREFVHIYQSENNRKFPPKVNSMKGANWGGLAVIKSLRNGVFG